MGLVELGSKSATAIEDMVAYAQETQHEKILRGLAVGIALTMYGRLQVRLRIRICISINYHECIYSTHNT